MAQKIIKVGSSVATIIPKDIMKVFKWKAGDSVVLDINKNKKEITISKSLPETNEMESWSDGFIKKYKKALDALSQK